MPLWLPSFVFESCFHALSYHHSVILPAAFRLWHLPDTGVDFTSRQRKFSWVLDWRIEKKSVQSLRSVHNHYDLDTIVGFCLCPCLRPSNHIIPISMHQDTKLLELQAITASWNRSKNTKRKLCTRSLKINVSVEHLHQHSLYYSFQV